MTSKQQDATGARQPFPGLRPFRRLEADIFFGRGEQIDELLATLEDNRFVAVVGASGSGKSSLVRAGLIPALEADLLSGAGPDWRMVLMRPGNAPFSRLAEALLEAAGGEQASDPAAIAFTEASLRSGPRGLLEAIEDLDLPPSANVLLLVDQFEEIFRFRQRDRSLADASRRRIAADERNDATAFVNMLLATSAENDAAIYGVITMRSDFLGDCDAFHGLPEAINNSQFLVPRLRREQLRGTITGPLDLFGARAEDAVVNRILNEIGSDPDQLPLMQHLLARMWSRVDHKSGSVLRVSDYEAVGGLDRALSRHADEAYEQLRDAESKRVAELMFRCLCDQGAEARLTRRMVTVSEVAAVAGVSADQVKEVAEVFLDPDRSFLTKSTTGALTSDTMLDISHETLFRQWGRLAEWVAEEARIAAQYRRLLETSRLWEDNQASLLDSPELDIALAWRDRKKPTAAWAGRYGGGFELCMEFLTASLAEQRARADRKRRDARRKNLTLIGTLGVVSTLMIAAGLLWLRSHRQAAEFSDLFIHSQLSLGTASIREGHMSEGLMRFWSAYENTEAGMPARDSALNLVAAWSQLAGRPLIHDSAVRRAVFDPVGTTILTLTDETTRLWSLETGEPLASPPFAAAGGSWQAIAVSPDAGSVLVAGPDSARLWDPRTGKPIGPELVHGEEILEVAFSADGSALLTKSPGAVQIWNAESGAPRGERLQLHGDEVFALTADGNIMFLGGSNPRLVDVLSGESTEIPLAAEEDVHLATFSPDGRLLITTSGLGGEAKLWNVPTRAAPAAAVMHHGIIETIAFSPDARLVLTGSDNNTAQLWDAQSGNRHGPPLQHEGTVVAAAFSPDGKSILTGSADNTAQLWNASTGQPLSHPLRHEGTVNSVAFSPNGQTLLTGSVGGAARVWHIRSRSFRNEDLDGHLRSVLRSAQAVAFSVDGQTVLTTSGETVNLWDAGTKSKLEPVFRHRAPIVAASFGPDGKTIFAAGGESARLWDMKNSDHPREEMSLESTITAAAISPAGDMVVTGGEGNQAELREFPSGRPVGKPLEHGDQVLAVAFSPDGRLVATGSADNTAAIWDVQTGTNLRKTHLAHRDAVSDIMFSPDGKSLLTASFDTKARFWDVESGELRGDPLLHSVQVITAIYHPSGRQAVTIDESGEVRVWDVVPPAADQPEQLRHSIVWRTGFEIDSQTVIRRLTQAEWLERKQSLDALGGPCDVRGWDDLSVAEQIGLGGSGAERSVVN